MNKIWFKLIRIVTESIIFNLLNGKSYIPDNIGKDMLILTIYPRVHTPTYPADLTRTEYQDAVQQCQTPAYCCYKYCQDPGCPSQ